MADQQPINSDVDNASAYSRRAAAADSIWIAQDHIRRGTRDAFGRLGFGFEERLLWPLQDRAATMGAPARVLSAAAAVVLAAGAVAGGLLVADPDGSSESAPTQVAVTSVPVETRGPAPAPPEPTLQGATPVFEPAEAQPPSEVEPAKAEPAKAIVESAPPEDSPAPEAEAEASAAAASTSAVAGPEVNGPPAGPEAVAVARDFAAAFLLYETGDTNSTVRQAFGETATPALAKALLERPPRLPANVAVPKAKVLNIVPAPSQGDVYPVSVSLLRVGLTSELRLDMEKRKGEGWRVTNVLG